MGHDPSGRRYARNAGRVGQRVRVVVQQPFAVLLERQAEHPPAPGRLLGKLLRIGGTGADERLVVPALLDDVAGNGVVQDGVGAGRHL